MGSVASLIWGGNFWRGRSGVFCFREEAAAFRFFVLRHWVDGISLFHIEYSSARYRGSRALGNPTFFLDSKTQLITCRASFGDTAVSLIQKLACSPVQWFLTDQSSAPIQVNKLPCGEIDGSRKILG